MNKPLAERLRPTQLDHYIGQAHLIGPKGTLRNCIASGVLPSLILWGPPGTGKTTLARLLANTLKRPFSTLSAIDSGVAAVRQVIDKAKKGDALFGSEAPVLFIDEIHRFSKSQQDSLLAAVEKGWITLIGATTENPSFEVIPALLSRCQVYTLDAFNVIQLDQLLTRALKHDELLKTLSIKIKEKDALFRLSGGDARKLLNTLELLVFHLKDTETPINITNKKVEDIVQKNTLHYDKNGEQHYDIISAYIKSIRGSDPNAAVYWLARMVEGGEDVKFIARRLLILAAEDIGLANPTALVIANNTFQAVQAIGYPEARIILSQCTLYLATSAKSNSAYKAIKKAQKEVKQSGNLQVPLALRNAPTKLMKQLNYGKGYKYAHEFESNFIAQEFLPDSISKSTFYTPGENPRENALKIYLESLWDTKYKF